MAAHQDGKRILIALARFAHQLHFAFGFLRRWLGLRKSRGIGFKDPRGEWYLLLFHILFEQKPMQKVSWTIAAHSYPQRCGRFGCRRSSIASATLLLELTPYCLYNNTKQTITTDALTEKSRGRSQDRGQIRTGC